jgi:hypothetical protein
MEAAMQGKKYIMGLFKNEDQVVSTLAALKKTAYEFQRVHSPIPSHKIMAALDLKKKQSRLVYSGRRHPRTHQRICSGYLLFCRVEINCQRQTDHIADSVFHCWI